MWWKTRSGLKIVDFSTWCLNSDEEKSVMYLYASEWTLVNFLPILIQCSSSVDHYQPHQKTTDTHSYSQPAWTWHPRLCRCPAAGGKGLSPVWSRQNDWLAVLPSHSLQHNITTRNLSMVIHHNIFHSTLGLIFFLYTCIHCVCVSYICLWLFHFPLPRPCGRRRQYWGEYCLV